MPKLIRHPALAVLLCAAALVAPRSVRAVNLVPNPSFETLSSCPTSFSQLANATPWFLPTAGTSDVYNSCVVGFPSFPVPGVPGSPFGFQNARTGVGMAGFIVSNVNDYHEYIEAPLNAPLSGGQTYLVQFYVNLADTADRAVDRLGAYLSVGQVGPLAQNTTLALTPQVESPANTFLTDTQNWMLVSGLYTAAGGESYITIGSFRDDASQNLQPTGNTWPGSDYYIDDVSVELQLPTVQACCMADGSCSMQFPGECTLAGGTPLGPGTSCASSPCGPTAAQRKSWGEVKSLYR